MRRDSMGQALLGFGLLTLISMGSAHASEIIVLRSSDLVPYKTVATAIGVRAASTVEDITLSQDKKSDLVVHAIWEARPEVIVALGARALDLTSREFPGIPVIFGMVADPSQYAEKKDAAAGVELMPSEMQVLKAIHAVLARAHKIALLFDPDRSANVAEEFVRTGKEIGITVLLLEFSKNSDVRGRLRSVAETCDALIVYPDLVLLSDKVFSDIVFQAFELGLPAVGYSSAFARKGALMSVEADYGSVGEDLSRMVDQLRNGRDLRSIGVHPPSRVRITVNKAVADELAVEVDVTPNGVGSGIAPTVDVIADRPPRR